MFTTENDVDIDVVFAYMRKQSINIIEIPQSIASQTAGHDKNDFYTKLKRAIERNRNRGYLITGHIAIEIGQWLIKNNIGQFPQTVVFGKPPPECNAMIIFYNDEIWFGDFKTWLIEHPTISD